MLKTAQRRLAVLLVAGAAAACSPAVDDAPPVATPSVTLSKSAPAIGSPLEMTYRFVVAPNAPAFTQDYWVFAHFIDSDGELMWTDDHQPSTPTRKWIPGSTVEYPRTMFIPKFPYVGPTRVEIGLFAPESGERLPLAGETEGQRAYRVATFDMRLETEALLVVFKDGFHETEVAPEPSGGEWQWSRKDATLSFRNPMRNIRLFLQVDQPITTAFTEPQRVELRIGDAVIDTIELRGGEAVLRRLDIPGERLGTGETVDIRLAIDKTFVPASVPALRSTDSRELGIRVFRAFVEPT